MVGPSHRERHNGACARSRCPRHPGPVAEPPRGPAARLQRHGEPDVLLRTRTRVRGRLAAADTTIRYQHVDRSGGSVGLAHGDGVYLKMFRSKTVPS